MIDSSNSVLLGTDGFETMLDSTMLSCQHAKGVNVTICGHVQFRCADSSFNGVVIDKHAFLMVLACVL